MASPFTPSAIPESLTTAASVRFAATSIGFYNTAPATQHAAIADAAAGLVIDAEARAALNTLLAAMRTLGLIAT